MVRGKVRKNNKQEPRDQRLETIMPNRLEHELSPYLLQHKDNPVDWYPWGDEAFERAQVEDKPIFLSIGYATCHWCHVMEHESFEDESVATLMNETFVCIKVDREERPDIDQVYMTYCQYTTGQGGWPLTIVMTPDRKPFFAATYLPKNSRHGRIGMLDLAPRIHQLWNRQKDEIQEAAAKNVELLGATTAWEAAGDLPDPELSTSAFHQLESQFDDLFGGFGAVPKFASPHQLVFLTRYGAARNEPRAIFMAQHTLLNMRRGGVFDHVGFGFHRYSTDTEWLVPHFEKMLYDQALVVLASVEMYEATREEAFKEIVERTLDYVMRDMRDGAGAFFSAEDADSEGVEGKFYVWSSKEIRHILGDELAALYLDTYQFEEEGNFQEEATGRLTGENIPHLEDFFHILLEEEPEQMERLEAARRLLFDVRKQRVHPLKDDKVLTDWNGLMVAALAGAGVAFERPDYVRAATEAVSFIQEQMRDENGRLLHRYRDGVAGLQSNLEDYAFVIYGLIDLFQATFDTRFLSFALDLQEHVDDHFWDSDQGGYFFSPDDGESLIARQKEAYDGAAPSGNSICLQNLLRLARLTGRTEFEERADLVLRAFGQLLEKHPVSFTSLLTGLEFSRGPSYEIVIVGELDAPDTREMLSALRKVYLPNKVILLKHAGNAGALAELAPYTGSMQALNDQATVYVCQNFVCNQPVSKPEMPG